MIKIISKPYTIQLISHNSSSSSSSISHVPSAVSQPSTSQYRIKDDIIEICTREMKLIMQLCLYNGQPCVIDTNTVMQADLIDHVDFVRTPSLFACDEIRIILYQFQVNGTCTLTGNYIFPTQIFPTQDFVKKNIVNINALIIAGFQWGSSEIQPKHPDKQSKVNCFIKFYTDILPLYIRPEQES